MSTAAEGAIYRFDGFVLDLVRGALAAENGKDVPLRHKSFQLLCLLVENAGRLLSREVIKQALWPSLIVSDDSVTQCVRDVRRALGDRAQTKLKTVLRRGYIFTAEVITTGTAHHPISYSATLLDKPSIAVLAFTNMSGDLDQEHFSDGISDDIITELSRSRSLFVIARNSSFAYKGRAVDIKQVAHELDVRYVVEGSVRRGGSGIRVTAQLIDAETGNYIWAERYDRTLDDLFAVQDEITTAVTTAILPAVADVEQQRALRKPPENLGAWEAYQRGLWHMGKFSPTDSATAQKFFDRAIAMDATFASAHAAMAMAIVLGGGTYGTLQMAAVDRLAGDYARKAIEIDPNDADGQAVVALAMFLAGSGEHVLEALSAAVAQHPNSSWANGVMGAILVRLGDLSHGRIALHRAVSLNPHDPSTALFRVQIAISYYEEREYARSVAVSKSIIERYPEYHLTYRWLAAALGKLGQAEEASAMLQKAMEIMPESFMRHVRSRPRWVRAEDYEHMLDGLRKAGWQG
jgi:adenylate cyclase